MPDPDVRHDRGRATEPADLSESALVACIQAAIAAPSIYNSQPWRFRIRDGGIDVFADWGRRLEVIDPSGRELLISVGAAVFNLRIAMSQQGRAPVLRLLPEATVPDLVARVVPGRSVTPGGAELALAAAIPKRHTNRRPFARTMVPTALLEELAAAAEVDGAILSVAGEVGRGAILGLVRTAEQRLRSQGIYRAELTERTHSTRARRDGVPPQAFGPWDALEALPLRDFGMTQPELRRPGERFEPYPTIVVLSTAADTADHWLRAGQALQRVLLLATVHGLAATPITQPLEIPALRELLTDAATGSRAQVILRLGYAQPTTPSPRRPLADVLLPGPQ